MKLCSYHYIPLFQNVSQSFNRFDLFDILPDLVLISDDFVSSGFPILSSILSDIGEYLSSLFNATVVVVFYFNFITEKCFFDIKFFCQKESLLTFYFFRFCIYTILASSSSSDNFIIWSSLCSVFIKCFRFLLYILPFSVLTL